MLLSHNIWTPIKMFPPPPPPPPPPEQIFRKVLHVYVCTNSHCLSIFICQTRWMPIRRRLVSHQNCILVKRILKFQFVSLDRAVRHQHFCLHRRSPLNSANLGSVVGKTRPMHTNKVIDLSRLANHQKLFYFSWEAG